MLEKRELQKLADKYDALHVKNYDSYQQTGEQRYMRNHERYEEMADAFRMAANAEEDYSAMMRYRIMISHMADNAAEALKDGDPEAMKVALRSIIDKAVNAKLYWKRGELE